MAYNLIDERWIPVERRSGRTDWIAPSGIVDPRDPPVRIASPRPDFDGGLLEFLIALLQTAAAPKTEKAWEKLFSAPPSATELDRKFQSVRDAFNLDGDGPRFMQDLTVADEDEATEVEIGALLIDRIGEKGLSESPTLFAKPGGFDALAYPVAAAALIVLQTYAPAGGRGQLTSLRGGGPLTTLVAADTLWETAWLNVLPETVFADRVRGDPRLEAPGAVFPWTARTRVSSARGGRATPPQAIHPLQHLWGLPRRFRLVFQQGDTGECGISGHVGVPVVRTFKSRPGGTSYEGDFRHPWTPYSLVSPGQPWNPKKGSPDGLPYRDWPQLVTGSENRRPATVVTYFAQTRRRELVKQPRLLAFGYAMSNMKPLQWCKSETPLVTVDEANAASFSADVETLIAVSEEVRATLSKQLKSAWSDRPADLDVFPQLNPAFWSTTEAGFFETVQAIKRSLEDRVQACRDAAKDGWLQTLHLAAIHLFDTFLDVSASLATPELRRAVLARRDLVMFTHPSSRKLRRILSLPVESDGRSPTQPARRTVRKEKTT